MNRRTKLHAVERNPAAYEAASREAILDLVRRMERAWNAGDARAYAAVFTPDSDYVAFDGTHLRGRDVNAAHHRQLFGSVLRDTRLVFEGTPTVRFLADDVGLVHARGAVLFPWQRDLAPSRRSVQTLVAVRGADGWRFAAFHNSRYRPVKLPSGMPLKLILAWFRARTALARRRNRPRRRVS